MGPANQTETSEQDFYNYIMSEQDEAMIAYEAKCKRTNERILKAIASQIGQGFVKDLNELIEELGVHSEYAFTDRPRGQFQQAYNAGCITGLWIVQYDDGEDSHHGNIWIKLKQGLWLELKFAD